MKTTMIRNLTLIATTFIMAGCVAQPEVRPPSNDDPANPQASEAIVKSIEAPIVLEPLPAADAESPDRPSMQHMDMSGREMKDMNMSGMNMKGMDMKGMDMSGMSMPGMSNVKHGRSADATQPAAEDGAK